MCVWFRGAIGGRSGTVWSAHERRRAVVAIEGGRRPAARGPRALRGGSGSLGAATARAPCGLELVLRKGLPLASVSDRPRRRRRRCVPAALALGIRSPRLRKSSARTRSRRARRRRIVARRQRLREPSRAAAHSRSTRPARSRSSIVGVAAARVVNPDFELRRTRAGARRRSDDADAPRRTALRVARRGLPRGERRAIGLGRRTVSPRRTARGSWRYRKQKAALGAGAFGAPSRRRSSVVAGRRKDPRSA